LATIIVFLACNQLLPLLANHSDISTSLQLTPVHATSDDSLHVQQLEINTHFYHWSIAGFMIACVAAYLALSVLSISQ
jgi:hypothetical protein